MKKFQLKIIWRRKQGYNPCFFKKFSAASPPPFSLLLRIAERIEITRKKVYNIRTPSAIRKYCLVSDRQKELACIHDKSGCRHNNHKMLTVFATGFQPVRKNFILKFLKVHSCLSSFMIMWFQESGILLSE